MKGNFSYKIHTVFKYLSAEFSWMLWPQYNETDLTLETIMYVVMTITTVIMEAIAPFW